MFSGPPPKKKSGPHPKKTPKKLKVAQTTIAKGPQWRNRLGTLRTFFFFFFGCLFLKPLKFFGGLPKWKFYATEGPPPETADRALFLKSATVCNILLYWQIHFYVQENCRPNTVQLRQIGGITIAHIFLRILKLANGQTRMVGALGMVFRLPFKKPWFNRVLALFQSKGHNSELNIGALFRK